MVVFINLPLDILLHIIRDMDVKDVMSLRSSCGELYKVTEARSIWHSINRAMLAIVPSPLVSSALNGMSSEELRQRALARVHLDQRWRSPVIIPRRVQTFKYKERISDAKLLPGGTWMLLLFADGVLQLRKIDCEEPVAIVECSTSARKPTTAVVELSLSNDLEHIAILVLITWNDLTQIFDLEARLYQIDVRVSALSLQMTIRIPMNFVYCAIGMGIVVLDGRTIGDRHMIYVKEIHMDDGVDKGIIMMLPSESEEWPYSVTILSQKQIMVTYDERIHIYDIPPLECHVLHPPAVEVIPQWAYVFDPTSGVGSPLIGPVLWKGFIDDSNSGTCVISKGGTLCVLRLSSHSSDVSINSHTVNTNSDWEPTAIGFRRIIWREYPTTFKMSTYSLYATGDTLPMSYLPLPETIDISTFALPSSLKTVAGATFDEESGRMCIPVIRGDSRVLVVDI